MRNCLNRPRVVADKEYVNSRVLDHPFSRSVLFHALFLALAFWLVFNAPPLKLNSDEAITFEIVQPREPSKDLTRTKSIVKPTTGEEVKEAKKDSFLSDKTRVVKEERTSKNIGEESASHTQVTAIPVTNVQPIMNKSVKLSDLGLKLTSKNNEQYEHERRWAKSETGEAMKGGEYIQGMKEGEVSALNTKEFVFYSYFERVRRQLDQSWQPILRQQIQRLYKHGRHLASNSDYTTRTLVTMNAKGEILRVQLLEESGTTDLDDAATEALNKAGPYPNPPKGLVEGSGTVEIRWDFILKT